MSKEQIWALLTPTIMMIVTLIGSLITWAITIVQGNTAKRKAADKAYEDGVFTDAANIAEEKAAAQKKKTQVKMTDVEKQTIAQTVAAAKLPNKTPAEITEGVLAAVGKSPSLGASATDKPSSDVTNVLNVNTAPADAPKPNDPPKPPFLVPSVTTIAVLIFALLSGACASGLDGVRQSCTNAKETVDGSYQTFANYYKLDQAAIRLIDQTDHATAVSTFNLHEPTAIKILAALDGVRAELKHLCSDSAFQAYASQKPPNYAATLALILQCATDAESAVVAIVNAQTTAKAVQ